MEVKIKLTDDVAEPYAVIYTNKITPLVSRIVSAMESMPEDNIITVTDKGRIFVLQTDDIYMVTVNDDRTVVHCREHTVGCSKRLYEFESLLGSGFMRISKSAIVNLKYLDHVEPSWGGSMLLTLKNGSQDYISRKYLGEFKKYLGL